MLPFTDAHALQLEKLENNSFTLRAESHAHYTNGTYCDACR